MKDKIIQMGHQQAQGSQTCLVNFFDQHRKKCIFEAAVPPQKTGSLGYLQFFGDSLQFFQTALCVK